MLRHGAGSVAQQAEDVLVVVSNVLRDMRPPAVRRQLGDVGLGADQQHLVGEVSPRIEADRGRSAAGSRSTAAVLQPPTGWKNCRFLQPVAKWRMRSVDSGILGVVT